MSSRLQEWQCPPQSSDASYRLGWVNEQNEEGLMWQRSQRGYSDWKKALDVLAGRNDPAKILEYRSKLKTGRLKRNIKEVIGASANIRPIWAYTSGNPAFREQATMMNNVVRAIYLEQFLDQGIKRTVQWAAATGKGWLRPVYRRSLYGTGSGNLEFMSYGAGSVCPMMMPSSGNFNEAYAVTLLDEYPVAMAHAMFPDFQDYLTPTKSKFWYSADIRKAAKGNMFQRIFSRWARPEESLLTDLYIPIRFTWVIDLLVNRTDKPIKMGPWKVDETGVARPQASWSYEVPALGSKIPTRRDQHGNMQFREANENDARLYPRRRLLISSENVLMYDGPSFSWCEDLELIDFALDDWAWEPNGFSLIRDGYEIQEAMDQIDRGNMDKVVAGLNLGLAYDINSGVTKNEAEAYDPMQPNVRIGFDGTGVEEPFRLAVPENVLKIDPMSLEFRKILESTGDYQLAINDVVALAKARALSADADSFEKVAEADGPIVRDISRNIERGLARVGNHVKFLVLQFETGGRVMQYVGPDNMTMPTFDFDPNSLVPSHLPDEFINGANGMTVPTNIDSIYTKVQRAIWFANNLRFYILPHSVHEIAQMAYKLGLVQLRKAGVQIDSQTIAEAWNLDLGAPFKGATPWDRFFEEQEAMAQMAVKMKMMVDALQQQGVQPTGAILGALATAMGSGSGGREGRPVSGLQSPRVVSKDGGARSTISQSGS